MVASPDVMVNQGLVSRLLSRSIVRYILVGGSLFVLDATVFLMLVHFGGVAIWAAQFVSRTVGAAVGFVGHRAFTFRQDGADHAHSGATQGVGYVAITGFNIFLSPLVVEGFAWLLPSSLLLAKIASECVIVVESFLLLRLVFRQKEPDGA